MATIKPMNEEKRKRLEAAGWRCGDTSDFLGLTPEQNELFETNRALTKLLANVRKEKHLTQSALATKLGVSQPRLAKLERGIGNNTVDAVLKALFAAGVSRQEIAQAITAEN